MRPFSFVATVRKALTCTRIWVCSTDERETSARLRRNCALPCSWRPTTPMHKTRKQCLSARMKGTLSRFETLFETGRSVLKGNSNTFRLDGKLAVVTGGASGIGRAVAQRFASSGACVRVLDIDENAAQTVVDEIGAAGGNAKAYSCDVSQRDNVEVVFNKISEETHIHILVNNAGISHVGSLEATSEEEFDKVFSVNVKGMYNCMYASVAYMKANGGGIILNMASIAGTSGLVDRFAYSMSKGAVVAMPSSLPKDTWPITFAAIAFRQRECIHLLSIIFCIVTIPAKNKRCSRSWKNRSPLGEWLSPRRSPPLLFFF